MNPPQHRNTFSPETLAIVARVVARYPEGKQKSALLPVLHLAQAEFEGWLSPEVMDYVASLLDIKPVEVYEVATFYTMFNLQPVGKCVLEVCRTGPCWLRGGEDVIRYIGGKLGISDGETSADGMFTLKTVECLASCGTAPVMQVGDDYLENLSCDSMDEVLDKLRSEMQTKDR